MVRIGFAGTALAVSHHDNSATYGSSNSAGSSSTRLANLLGKSPQNIDHYTELEMKRSAFMQRSTNAMTRSLPVQNNRERSPRRVTPANWRASLRSCLTLAEERASQAFAEESLNRRQTSILSQAQFVLGLQQGKWSPILERLEQVRKNFLKRDSDTYLGWLNLRPMVSQRDQRMLDIFVGVVSLTQAFALGVEIQVASTSSDFDLKRPSMIGFLCFQMICTAAFTADFFIRCAVRYSCAGVKRALGGGVCFLFDVFLLFCLIADVTLQTIQTQVPSVGGSGARSLHNLQLLRLWRLLRLSPQLELLMKGTAGAVRAASYAIILLAVLAWGGALLCAEWLRNSKDVCPSAEGACVEELFGTVGDSYLSHIKMALLEAWPDIAEPLRRESDIWSIYVSLYLVITGIGLMSVVVSVICQRIMDFTHRQEDSDHAIYVETMNQKERLMELLFMTAIRGNAVHLGQDIYLQLLQTPLAQELLRDMGINLPMEHEHLVSVLDRRGRGKIDVFDWKEGLLSMRGSRGNHLSHTLQYSLIEQNKAVGLRIAKAEETIRELMKERVFKTTCQLCQEFDTVAALVSPPRGSAPGPVETKLRDVGPQEELEVIAEACSDLTSSLDVLCQTIKSPHSALAAGSACGASAAMVAELSVQTDEQPPWEEGPRISVLPRSKFLPGIALRASRFEFPTWAAKFLDFGENEPSPEILTGSTRSTLNRDGFFSRLARNQLTESDIERLARTGHAEHHHEVGLSRRRRIFGTPDGGASPLPLPRARRGGDTGKTSPSPLRCAGVVNISSADTSRKSRYGRFGGAGYSPKA